MSSIYDPNDLEELLELNAVSDYEYGFMIGYLDEKS